MGKTKTEDTDWVKTELPDWRSAIYAVDDPTSQQYLHTPMNKGKESMAYITYLIDFYDDLSDINVFIHSHADGYPRAWHNEPINDSNYSAVLMLQLLNTQNVLDYGYANLRCNTNPGCQGGLHPKGANFKEDAIEPAFRSLWSFMYGTSKPIPEEVSVACCAQFAVSKDRIREQPKKFYERARDWLVQTQLGDEMSGRAFEYYWHIMFGMDVVQ
ncbi:hypothetical protein ABW19_dt0208676 [Dactylella cylindrospora]|nr:hypothetical protein ABW19_dt0208676 [Dactylella cylindrospora]